MRLNKRKFEPILEGDMTPMIDMAFQLITFFMLVINFSDVEQDQRVTLPASELAIPPEAPYEKPLTVHLTDDGKYIFGGALLPSLEALRSALLTEKRIVELHTNESLADVTVVIRADEDARTGQIQEMIQACQELEFERFALRGKQSDTPTIGN